MDFKTELKNYQDIVNKELEKYLRKDECIEKVLNNAMEYSLMAGGKRLRPILVLATYKLFKENIEECLPYAVAIEMVHNFSLIHDDLPGIDNDDFRHGKPTNHKQFNEATAILAGDGLLNNAYMVIANDLQHTNNEINMDNINSNHNINSKNCIKNLKNLENKNNPISYVEKLNKKIRIFNEFSNAVDRMIAGEYIDTEYEGKQVLEENLEYMDENKTGALLKLSVRMGAILAECSETDVERLTAYAKKIGLAFQIKDDILSEEGDEKILGKPVGNDKKLNKCTYVSKYGLDGAKAKLNELIEGAIKDIEIYNENAEFLKDLAIYIKEREK